MLAPQNPGTAGFCSPVREGRGARGEGLGRPRALADLAVLGGRAADKRQPAVSDRRSGAGTCQHICPPAHVKEGPAGLGDAGQAPPHPPGGCRTLPLRRAARLGAPESCCLTQPGWPSFPGQGGGLQTEGGLHMAPRNTGSDSCPSGLAGSAVLASWSCFYIQETGATLMGSTQHRASQEVRAPSHRVLLFSLSWTAAHQASLSITNSQSLLKLMSIESVMPSNHLILCRPLLLLPSIFPATRSFRMSRLFASGAKVSELQLQCQSFQ